MLKKGWILELEINPKKTPIRQPELGTSPVAKTDHLLEEEKLPFYTSGQYYPVHLDEIFNSRYRVVGKLGYGAYSTTWLCRDER